MPTAFTQKLHLAGPDATDALARAIAPQLLAGDVLLLEGPIGAGKTQFARAVIQSRLAAFDAIEDVPSPTYTLVQTYEAGPLEIWHADLYRLSHSGEAQELGLADAFERAICLVEWPDRLGQDVPRQALCISFVHADDGGSRDVTISADTGAWGRRLHGALASLATPDRPE